MEKIRISGKNLGELALPNFCPRCFWLKLRCDKLPFQIFPGIFAVIDSYSKKVTNLHFERHEKIPAWLNGFGSLARPIKAPHHSKFNVFDPKTNILLTGTPDEIFQKDDQSYFIVDYKTAKFTGTQDKLLPMYRVQVNAYAYIAERFGFKPITGVGLVYYEPFTDISSSNLDSYILKDGFSMNFNGKLLPIELDTGMIEPLLARTRELYDRPKPPKTIGCKDCDALEFLVAMVIAR